MTDKGAGYLAQAIVGVALIAGLVALAITGHETIAESVAFFLFILGSLFLM